MAVLITASAGAQQSAIVQLDEAIKAAADFKPGADSGPMRSIENMAIASLADEPLRAAVEERFIAVLKSGAGVDMKMLCCRLLQTVGTDKCIPVIESLLTDPALSHGARYALGPMESPAAGDALLRGLRRTRGAMQAGIINTLADRREPRAMTAFVRLLRSDDPQVASAAARGLGRLGGDDAVEALRTARTTASDALIDDINDALLVCAEKYLSDGLNDKAYVTYNHLSGHRPIARLRGIVAARGSDSAAFLATAIKDSNGQMQKSAIALVPLLKGAAATSAFVEVLPSLSAEGQELMIRALGERGDATATAAIAAATRSEHEQVRLAAVDALGAAGDASAVSVLAAAAAKAAGAEKLVARASLARLGAPGVDAALLKVSAHSDAGIRAESIRALADRKAVDAKNRVLEASRDDDQFVRREAIRAAGILADRGDLPAMIALMVLPKEPADRSVIEQAIVSVFARLEDKTVQADSVLRALTSAPVEARPSLLKLLRIPGTPDALAAVRAGLAVGDESIRDAAVRTLADWPDAAPADDLLRIVNSDSSRVHKVLALRGYVRMAGLSQNGTAMYARAMELARTVDDRKLVLAGLGNADSADALALVEKHMADEALKAEAALAAVQIADRLRIRDATGAKAALTRVVAAEVDGGVRKKAQDVINEMEQFEGYILTWLTAGPYIVKGKDSRAVFDAVLGPETSEAVKWQRLDKGVGAWDINLESMYGGRDHVAAYVKTRVWSPKPQEARLELGSDDAIKVWLNGKLVHANYQHRGLQPRQDTVDVNLKEGHNDLMLKVVDHEGGWQFCARIRKPGGSAIADIRIQTE